MGAQYETDYDTVYTASSSLSFSSYSSCFLPDARGRKIIVGDAAGCTHVVNLLSGAVMKDLDPRSARPRASATPLLRAISQVNSHAAVAAAFTPSIGASSGGATSSRASGPSTMSAVVRTDSSGVITASIGASAGGSGSVSGPAVLWLTWTPRQEVVSYSADGSVWACDDNSLEGYGGTGSRVSTLLRIFPLPLEAIRVQPIVRYGEAAEVWMQQRPMRRPELMLQQHGDHIFSKFGSNGGEGSTVSDAAVVSSARVVSYMTTGADSRAGGGGTARASLSQQHPSDGVNNHMVDSDGRLQVWSRCAARDVGIKVLNSTDGAGDVGGDTTSALSSASAQPMTPVVGSTSHPSISALKAANYSVANPLLPTLGSTIEATQSAALCAFSGVGSLDADDDEEDESSGGTFLTGLASFSVPSTTGPRSSITSPPAASCNITPTATAVSVPTLEGQSSHSPLLPSLPACSVNDVNSVAAAPISLPPRPIPPLPLPSAPTVDTLQVSSEAIGSAGVSSTLGIVAAADEVSFDSGSAATESASQTSASPPPLPPSVEFKPPQSPLVQVSVRLD